MELYSSSKQHRIFLILMQFFTLLLFTALLSAAAHARNMELTISATPDPAVAGEELIYTIAYRNTGGNACPKATLHFILPQHVGLASGTTKSWSLGTVQGGRHGSRTVRVKVDSPLPPNTELITTANVSSNVTCQTTVTDDTNVRPALLVNKTSSLGTVEAGGQLTYTLHFDNAGKGNATNVILQDTLPADVIFVSATGSHSESGGIVSWDIGTVIAGAKGSVTLTVDVDNQLSNGTILTNSGTINSNETDPSPFSLDVKVHSEPVLTLTKTAPRNPVSPGDHLLYTLHYENSGTDVATNLVLRDTLPAGVIFDSAPGGSLSGNIVSWNLADLPPNHSGDLTLSVIVDNNVVNGDVLENSATLDSDETQPVTALKDVTVLAEPAFAITKSAAKNVVNPGDELSYSINYTNIGSGQGTGIIIEDDLPAGVSFKSASGGGSHVNGKVTWNLAALSAGAKGSVSLIVTVNSPLSNGTILLNTVSMVSTETQPHRVTDVNDVTVHSEPVLKLSKTSSKDPVNAGASLIYTIAYENTGSGAASSLTLVDDLPAEVTFISASSGGSHVNGKVTWNLPALSAGAKGSVHLSVTVNSPLSNGTVLHNVTTIDSAETPPLSDFDDVIVSSSAALKLTKTASRDVVNPGDELVYTIAYENVGSDSATHVVLQDILPADVTFKSSPNGVLNAAGNLVTWDLGTIAAGAAGSEILTVTVNRPLADGTILNNTVHITSTETPHVVADELQVPVLSEPVLELHKTASAQHVNPGDFVMYTIEYKNIGSGDATGTILTDTLPGGVTLSYATDGGTESGGVVTWPATTILAGAPAKKVYLGVIINGPLADGTVLYNHADLVSKTAQLTSEVDIIVFSEPVLELNKSASKTQVSPGDELTYTIEYNNVGTDAASGIKLEDQLPADVTFISASPGGTAAGNIVSWDIGSMAAGGIAGSVFVKVRVNSPLADGTILQNPANIRSTKTQPVSTTASVTVLSHPLLELTKTAARPHVNPGDDLVYTLEYKNSGTDQAELVTLEDPIPGDVTFVSATGNPSVSNGIIHWDIGTMPAGAQAGSVTVTVNINDPLPNGAVIHNPASIQGKGVPSETAQADVSVISAPVLEITKTASRDPVLAGDTLVYTLNYKNVGTDQASAVKLEDKLPGNVTFISASNGGTLSGSVVSWDLGSLSPGGTADSVSIEVRINDPLADGIVLYNLASISSIEKAHASSFVEVAVDSTPVLELTKVASADPVAPGDMLSYTLNYKNIGSAQASGVVLEDHLPANVSFVTATDGGIESSSGIVTWDLGLIPAAASKSVTITVRVDDPLNNGIVLQNSAAIKSNETHSVSVITDVTVGTGPALELTKSASRDPVEPGDTLDYTIEYKNVGNSPANSVVLEDDLPPGVRFISASHGGVGSTGKVIWDLGTLPAGASGTVAITVAIDTTVSDGTILHNAATIKSNETHPVSTLLSVTVLGSISIIPVATPIPALNSVSLLILILLLLAIAGYSKLWRKV